MTVGTQLPFDRMIRAIDEWATLAGRNDVFGQIGPAGYLPTRMKWERFIEAPEFRQRVEQAELVVAHAGMGSIITALELGKPIIVMPRRASLGEHRNEHQLATAKRFEEQGRITVAWDEAELVKILHHPASIRSGGCIDAQASGRLIEVLRAFVTDARVSRIAARGCGKSMDLSRGVSEHDEKGTG